MLSVSDPVLADYFGVGLPNYAGTPVGEGTALSLSAVYRAVALIAGTLASLPMPTLREVDGIRTPVGSFLDEPGGPDGPTRYEWTETVLTHLLLHGNAFLAHVWNGAGALAALVPIHPLSVNVRWVRRDEQPRPGGKVFTAMLIDGTTAEFDASTMTHIPALSTDGLRGLSVIATARNSFGTAIAGDRAAARMFGNGALISGMVTPEDDLTGDEAKAIKDSLTRSVAGWDNAADIAVINRKLKFTPWTMSAEDAQFLQSRSFQVEEIARWFGIPPHMLGLTEKVTSWGAGIEVQNRGLARTVLAPWAARIEQRLSRLLPQPRFVRFDFAGLERPTPETEIALLIQQVQAGLLTVDEARHKLNLPPTPVAPAPAPEVV
jgi:HK97 family phage portal protein